jgi:flagellar hook-basal body complex protein FliE
MALNVGSLSSALTPNAAARLAALARVDAMRYTTDGDSDTVSDNALSVAGLDGAPTAGSAARYAEGTKGPSFEQALLKAMDGVSSSQNKSDDLLQKVVADPKSVDAQDVTIAMAEANMSLNLAKTILSRLVTAWRDVISTR